MAIQDAPTPRPRAEGDTARRNNLLDVLAWTMLGEAANQGDTGMSAIAHVVLNRANSGRYPRDPLKVALQPQQFSAWNSTSNGGNNPKARYPRNTEAFQHARSLAADVLDGKTPDPTGGATHYWAPVGMKSGADPYWAADEERRAGQGRLTLGDHVFLPRNRQPPSPASMSPGARDRAGAAQNVAQAALAAWPDTGPPLPRRRPDNNPRPPAFIPTPPVPFDMPPRIQQARTGNYPPLPSPAPLANPMAVAYAPPDGSATLAPASVPMYRPGWRDAPEYGSANASLSAVGAGQKVGEAASGAWKGRPPVPRITQAGYTPLSGTVSGLIDGTINEITLPRPVTQTASAVPPSGYIQGVDPTQRPNFIPVPQGSRPNVPEIPGLPWLSSSSAIPARAGATQVADAARNAWQNARPVQPPAMPMQAPVPMPYPAFRTPQVPTAPAPVGTNWLQSMGTGLNQMQQQVAGMFPQPSRTPTWFEQQTGNPGSRGPNMLQLLGMINTQRLLNGQAGNRPTNRTQDWAAAARRILPGSGVVTTISNYPDQPVNTGSTPGQYRSSNDWFNSVTDPFYRG